MSLRSMTGFARVRKDTGQGEMILSVKSLNHRGLDLHFHLPAELEPFESAMRSVFKEHIGRGHVEVRVSLARRRDVPAATLNRPLLDAYCAAFRQMSKDLHLTAEPDLNAALSIPGMFTEPLESEVDEELQLPLLEALSQALEGLNSFRKREGAEIGRILSERNVSIKSTVVKIMEIRDRALPAFHSRLSERLGELLRGASVDPQRLAQEVAILADRSDIHEELARLAIHSGHLDELLKQGGEAGKKLDFLLQEMNREANTILSKTTGIGELGLGITDLALALKSDIEKIREQALNLE